MLQGAWDSATQLSAPVPSMPFLKKRRTSSKKTTLAKFCMGLQVLWLLQLVYVACLPTTLSKKQPHDRDLWLGYGLLFLQMTTMAEREAFA